MYFSEFSTDQQFNMGVLVGHQTYHWQILIQFFRFFSEYNILLEIEVLTGKPFGEVLFFGD